MPRITVLGGCGAVGSVAVRMLAASDVFSDIVVGDINIEKAVKHRIHSMELDIPMFLDGKFTTVRLFDEDGRALEEEVDFPDVGRYRVYAYPHPETITLPRYLKITSRVTNLGTVLPPAYAELIKGMVRLGLTAEAPLDVGGQKVVPLEFAVSFVLSQRERLLKEAGITEPMGCLKIAAAGKKEGERNAYIFSMSSRGREMVEGTGIPAALGAMLMGMGKIETKGVFPPEVGVSPLDLLELAQKQVKIGDKSGLPIMVQHIDKEGNLRQLDIRQLVQGLYLKITVDGPRF